MKLAKFSIGDVVEVCHEGEHYTIDRITEIRAKQNSEGDIYYLYLVKGSDYWINE